MVISDTDAECVDQSPGPGDHPCLCRGGMTLFPSRDLPRAAAASEQPDSNCVFLDTDPNISASTTIYTCQEPATLRRFVGNLIICKGQCYRNELFWSS